MIIIFKPIITISIALPKLSGNTHMLVYDTLFVTLAVKEAVALITYDKKVLVRFPEIARKPSLT